MAPMLMSRYAKDGSEKSRRQMLAMCQSDPEILADVLGHFVSIASQKLKEVSELIRLFGWLSARLSSRPLASPSLCSETMAPEPMTNQRTTKPKRYWMIFKKR
jgi:hypothetical protein